MKIPKAKAPRSVSQAGGLQRRANVTGHSYHTGTRNLDVTFGSGRTYRYADVSAKKASSFGRAESRGAFLHQEIVPHHAATEIFPDRDT